MVRLQETQLEAGVRQQVHVPIDFEYDLESKMPGVEVSAISRPIGDEHWKKSGCTNRVHFDIRVFGS